MSEKTILPRRSMDTLVLLEQEGSPTTIHVVSLTDEVGPTYKALRILRDKGVIAFRYQGKSKRKPTLHFTILVPSARCRVGHTSRRHFGRQPC